jgi:hypothetical protein
MVAAVTSEKRVGMWLPAEHFTAGGTRLRPVVQPNLPQPLRKNKTNGLVTPKGSGADAR